MEDGATPCLNQLPVSLCHSLPALRKKLGRLKILEDVKKMGDIKWRWKSPHLSLGFGNAAMKTKQGNIYKRSRINGKWQSFLPTTLGSPSVQNFRAPVLFISFSWIIMNLSASGMKQVISTTGNSSLSP